MDRRTFLRFGSCGVASFMLPGLALAQDFGVRSHDAALSVLEDKPLERIAFGSCNQSHQNQKFWQLIGRAQPDLWVWLGDNIYADNTTIEERARRFTALKDNSYYKDFRQTVPILGTWDDHDFASNNMNGRFPEKAASKEALLNFLDVGHDAKVWNHSGVYQSFRMGPPGRKTHLILLDLRFNMDTSWVDKKILGDDQWQWLQDELSSSDADLIIIGSSLNVTSPLAGLGLEGWAGFPAERQKFYQLLASVDAPIVLLSGDRHFAEITRIQLGSGKPIHEVMSSGLT
ncbi:MAG: alkaline phosphatase family protein, partial [Pseudobdellovibrionaceae bacterium]|nr:alkaline phosphatase family protein [Pseudobdellovibrionaceae bacterium]